MVDLVAGAAALGACALIAVVCLIVYSLLFGQGPVAGAGAAVLTRTMATTVVAFVVVAILAAAAWTTCPQMKAPACQFQVADLVPGLG